ncbi:MAG: hypothetical protein HY922_13090 [Elusimicrobia bacterium]|nr:hypothetical protein [Elusimicrobiota bacterium]
MGIRTALLAAMLSLPASARAQSGEEKLPPLDLPEMLGVWSGQQMCTSGSAGLRVSISTTSKGFLIEYAIRQRMKGSRALQTAKGRVPAFPVAKKPGVYSLQFELPSWTIFRLPKVPASLRFDPKKESVSGQLELGMLGPLASGGGSGRLSEKRGKLSYKLSSSMGPLRDICTGTLRREKRAAKQKNPAPAE